MESFETLGLSPEIVGTVTRLGFDTPTPVQLKAIPILLQGNQDVVALAQTGTGKTAAFGLPLIQLIDEKDNTTRTCLGERHDVLVALKQYRNGLKLYGGGSIKSQSSDSLNDFRG